MPYVPPPPTYRPDPLEMEFMNQRLAILESDMPDERKKAALREARARYEKKRAKAAKMGRILGVVLGAYVLTMVISFTTHHSGTIIAIASIALFACITLMIIVDLITSRNA